LPNLFSIWLMASSSAFPFSVVMFADIMITQTAHYGKRK
jgi:hypothetical protein